MDILIIDDDRQVLDVHRRLLERAGYMVKTAENGLAAFAVLQEQTFRAILLDLQMPFLKGDSFFEELKREYPEMAERVIFVTGWGGDPEQREFLDQTGRPVLTKPVEYQMLVAAVRKVADRTTQQ